MGAVDLPLNFIKCLQFSLYLLLLLLSVYPYCLEKRVKKSKLGKIGMCAEREEQIRPFTRAVLWGKKPRTEPVVAGNDQVRKWAGFEVYCKGKMEKGRSWP